MRRFLPIARRAPTNHVLAPVVALVGLWGRFHSGAVPADRIRAGGHERRSAADVHLYAEPNYELIQSWDPQAVPEDWRIARARWLRLNGIRTALTLLVLVRFSAATYLPVI